MHRMYWTLKEEHGADLNQHPLRFKVHRMYWTLKEEHGVDLNQNPLRFKVHRMYWTLKEEHGADLDQHLLLGEFSIGGIHGVHCKMIFVDNFFEFFRLLFLLYRCYL